MTTRVGLPSRGRLRDEVISLLDHAGFSVSAFRGADARATVEGIEFIEMRPRDAAAWLAAGRLTAAFISTDIALEYDLGDWPSADLGFAKSDLVLAARDDDRTAWRGAGPRWSPAGRLRPRSSWPSPRSATRRPRPRARSRRRADPRGC
jgi:ATP phosphoribosyltransferase